MSLRDYAKYGNTIEKLSAAIRAGNVSHAYLFEGNRTLDKVGFAKAFAKAIMCQEMPGIGCDSCSTCRKIDHDNYEDLYFVRPTVKNNSSKASVKDDDMETLQAQLKLIPSGGSRNIAIIEGADTMTVKAQNRFLKSLEEPTEGTVVMILCENTENLLPTINSRCIKYRLLSTEASMDEGMNPLAAKVMDMVFGNALFVDIIKVLDKELKDRDSAMVFLDAAENHLSGRLKETGSNAERGKIIFGVECVEQARRKITRNILHKYAVREMIVKLEDYKW